MCAALATAVPAYSIVRGARVTVRVRRVANAPLAEPQDMSMTIVRWPSAVYGSNVLEMRADAPVPCPAAPRRTPRARAARLDVHVYACDDMPLTMVGYMLDQYTFVGAFASALGCGVDASCEV